MRALLFDLDGTLTKGGGAGSRALAKALHTREGPLAELRKMRLDGMTDRGIARTLLAVEQGDPALPLPERARLVTEQQIDDVLSVYLTALESECIERAYLPQPGIPRLIERLQAQSSVLLGLCTGNLEKGAELKLRSAGLWGPWRFGGYGSDAEPRPEIVRAAWSRAQTLGATEGLVIGDTPRDITAAHAAGLPALAVATGRFSVHELLENGADLIAESFADLAAAEALLLGPLR